MSLPPSALHLVDPRGEGDLYISDLLSVVNQREPAPEHMALNRSFNVLVLDPQGRVIRCNSLFLRSHGATSDEVIGRRLPDLGVLAGEGGERAFQSLLETLGSGLPQTAELGRRNTAGEQRWYHAVYTPVLDKHKQVQQIVEMSLDITDRVLRSADEHCQLQAIQHANVMLEFTLDGVILDANPRAQELFGYTAEELIGRHHRLLVDPAIAESPEYAAFWRRIASGHYHASESRRLGKHGREIWVRAIYVPVAGPDGVAQRVVAYAVDVTAERLQQAEFQWHVAALHKSHCVISFDRHGVVLDANQAMLNALGYAREEVIGRHHRLFVEPSYSHSSEYAAFWQALESGHYQSGQFRRIGKGGREVWLQANYSPIFDLSGHLVKVVKYASVITHDKQRQAEHQGQIAAIHKAQCVISFELDGTIVDANDNFLDAMGYRLSDVRGQHHRMFVDTATALSSEYDAFWKALARGEYQGGEYKRFGRDGREVWLQATYNPILDSSGRPTRVVKYATDVTEQKLQQADFQSQIDAIHKSQGVVTFSTDGCILDANPNFLKAVGYTLEELKGRHHAMLLDASESESGTYAAFWETLRSGHFLAGRYRRVGKDGRVVWLQASYNPVFDLNGKLWKIVKFATDVTTDVAMAEAFEDAQRQAQHDPATSLPNRMRLASFMTASLQGPGARLAVMYLDLDGFKPINDSYGHHVGDRVLGEVADRLRRTLKPDQLVARVGGDEFVIAAPNLSEEALEAHCIQVLESLAQPIRHDGGDLVVGVSIGVAVSPADGITPDDLLRAADSALYQVKRDGGASYRFFGAEMNERIHANRQLTEDMRRGMAAGEFYLEFQPRFDASSQSIRSAEALVRWQHPELGRVGPDRFIPLAERNGMIVALGDWVLEAACRAAARWPQVGVSVNVSPVQFRDGRLVERIRQVLLQTGASPGQLEVEITEGVLMEDAARAAKALAQLKALGIKLAIDDFGTGYSSLSYLRQFPFDVIKIDRQFISDIEHREGSRDIVKAILAMGKALGLSVTAEGVETAGQLRILVEDECAEVQGFLLSRPIREQALDSLLEGQSAMVNKLPAARPRRRGTRTVN
jgi:diguanylate cyclase (GGDEF)-like protein/PAS domain S-box-containing protein